ncbi:hypothetical protein ABS768_16245 [Flavobacterium sp. ST-75]|uniref:Uncharacterized protein n=1 Tax=Flavobacterium rhizophilum TaxID=3163296 RepID=A0ABW8YFN3_9FLAO
MKKLFCFLAIAATAAFTSCSSDDDSGNNDNGGGGDVVTGITLTSSSSTVTLGNAFTFTVKNNLNEDVTAASTIYVDDTALEGNTYTATEAGTYTVHATNGDFTSADVTVTVTEETIVITSLSVSYDEQVVSVNETITFTATANGDMDVTADAVFYVNGTEIEGNTFSSDVVATYQITASYEGYTTDAENDEEYAVVAFLDAVNLTETDFTNTALLYLGTLPTNTTTYDYWRVIAYNSELAFDELTEDPSTFVVYDIVVPATEGTITLPNDDTALFNTITSVVVDNVNYPVVDVNFEGATFGFTSDLSDDTATTIAYTVNVDFNETVSSSNLNINYDGAYSGWYDLSTQGRSANVNSFLSKMSQKSPIRK